MGQLGNQMFQLASAHGIAQSRGSKLCTIGFAGTSLDESVELTHPIAECATASFRPVTEAGFGVYDPSLAAEPGNITLLLYLQSYRYFHEPPFRLKPRAWAAAWVQRHGVSVGIHVRRGDYAARRANGGRPPPALYFAYCLRRLRRRHGPLRALVVSDDPDWVRDQPALAAALLHRGSPAEDMALLAACPHVIASLGTFGWWAMRLRAQPGDAFYYADPWDYDLVPERRAAFRPADHFVPAWTGVGDAELAAFADLERTGAAAPAPAGPVGAEW
jgi:galactoside 2-L-fucosyltransferase 1/2